MTPPELELLLRKWNVKKNLRKLIRRGKNGCWNWIAATNKFGYAVLRINGRQNVGLPSSIRVHRQAYEFAKGPIPKGLHIDHLCRNRRCVNPDHLEAVTSRENTLRGDAPPAKNARKTHCLRGHPLFGENMYLKKNGSRHCKSCQSHWSNDYKLRKRESRLLILKNPND